MNDAWILDLIDRGLLRVDVQTGRVWYQHPIKFLTGEVRWKEKVAVYDESKGRYRFHLDYDGHKTTIAKARLLFLAKTHQSVDVVDHLDTDRTNDSIDNLGEHSREESDRQGRELQRAKIVKDAEDFFDYIALNGCEPPDN